MFSVCFFQLNLDWKQTFKEKILLAWCEPAFNFWPALFRISFLPVVFTSELPSPRPTTSITKALKSNVCYVQLKEHVGLLLTAQALVVSKTWFFTGPLKTNSEGCQSRHSQILLQFKWMFMKFFPVFAQLYLMKRAWLPTTQDFLQYACWTHSYRNNSELN